MDTGAAQPHARLINRIGQGQADMSIMLWVRP